MAAELEDEQSSTSRSDESDGDDSSSLSLCDLPLADHDGSDGPNSSDDCQLSPPPTDPFEFFSGNLSAAEEMCSAEDVFLKGNLLPYKPPLQLSPTKRSDASAPKNAPFDHRRSESLDGINRPRGDGGLAGEYQRLRRAASETDPRTPQPPPPPPPPPPQPPATPRSRPKWYLVVFGSVRVPAAMEMKDIRNRQRRRRTTTLLAECGGWRCEGGRGPWKLLRSLSCKGVESTVAASPLNFVSRVRG
ncbi:serine/arginine repetitive matrix protein 1-like [Cocos nucifera]|uniref:Serine/arginine repetitive matrix protein 1-like n=1 Tax=Cocos nucifera TaxID=13894 RepID=A0A8K0NA31_COCNU|nr:serine/arginine repetitive matrix protein 1-like [Cocos nucifera]